MQVSEQQNIHWTRLFNTVEEWFHNPDPIAIRAALTIPAALHLGQSCVWLMLIGPSSSGKTEIHFPLLRAYPNVEETSDINIAGLMSMGRGHKGEGTLQRLGVKGLWLIKDFGSIISMKEEKRNELLGAMREIFDGKWSRQSGRGGDSWVGTVNIVAAATPAVENAHKVNSELGSRFVHIRLSRPAGDGVRRKAAHQAGKRGIMAEGIKRAAGSLFVDMTSPNVSSEWEGRIYNCAEMIAYARTPVVRSFQKGNIVDVGETEGATRVYQEILSILLGDAALHGQSEIGSPQLPLLKRLTFDTMPGKRGRILQTLSEASTALRRTDLKELCGINHPTAFARALEELGPALKLVDIDHKKGSEEGTYARLSPKMSELAKGLKE